MSGSVSGLLRGNLLDTMTGPSPVMEISGWYIQASSAGRLSWGAVRVFTRNTDTTRRPPRDFYNPFNRGAGGDLLTTGPLREWQPSCHTERIANPTVLLVFGRCGRLWIGVRIDVCSLFGIYISAVDELNPFILSPTSVDANGVAVCVHHERQSDGRRRKLLRNLRDRPPVPHPLRRSKSVPSSSEGDSLVPCGANIPIR